MNLSPKWVHFLFSAGIEAVQWSSLGPSDAPDPRMGTYASEHGCVVLTRDLDFGKLAVGGSFQNLRVLLVRVEFARPDQIGAEVLDALSRYRSDLEAGGP